MMIFLNRLDYSRFMENYGSKESAFQAFFFTPPRQ
jgi:hypothetical protein